MKENATEKSMKIISTVILIKPDGSKLETKRPGSDNERLVLIPLGIVDEMPEENRPEPEAQLSGLRLQKRRLGVPGLGQPWVVV